MVDQNNFTSILESVVLAQNPELYLYATKLNKGMIPEVKTHIMEVRKSSSLYPHKEGYDVVKREKGRSEPYINPTYITVEFDVVKHDLYANKVMLEDGKWYEAKSRDRDVSDWNWEPSNETENETE